MSVSGVSTSSFFDHSSAGIQQQKQSLHQEFMQLGQDLQSGNLTAAQSDFAALEQNNPLMSAASSSSSAASAPNTTSIGQAFNRLQQDLQTGSLSAAKQDYAALQQALQSGRPSSTHHHQNQSSGSAVNSLEQLLGQLGQALQGGNVSAALQAYSALAQDVPQLGSILGSTASGSGVTPVASALSVTA
jgi:hypothetical protein